MLSIVKNNVIQVIQLYVLMKNVRRVVLVVVYEYVEFKNALVKRIY